MSQTGLIWLLTLIYQTLIDLYLSGGWLGVDLIIDTKRTSFV